MIKKLKIVRHNRTKQLNVVTYYENPAKLHSSSNHILSHDLSGNQG